MTVTLIIGQEEIKVDNSTLRTSELVSNLLSDLQQSNVEISVPLQYVPVINIYLVFVNQTSSHGKEEAHHSDLPAINDVKTLALCFVMESFFADSTFFAYLISQAHGIWSAFHLHIPSLPDDRSVYLHSPYEFVPGKYRNRPSFFKDWLAINHNKEVVVNGNEIYHTRVTYYDNGCLKEFKTYQTINGKEIGSEHRGTWYSHGQPTYRGNFRDGQRHGLWEHWYEMSIAQESLNKSSDMSSDMFKDMFEDASVEHKGQLQYRYNYKNGKKDGLQEEWYADSSLARGEEAQLQYQHNYKDDKRDGLQQAWYSSGQRWYQTNCKNDESHGLHKGWHMNGQLQYWGNYKNGKEDGLWEEWYANGQLEYRGYYKDGLRHGLWEAWYVSGQPDFRGNYKNGKEDGLREAWFADGQPKHQNYSSMYCTIL